MRIVLNKNVQPELCSQLEDDRGGSLSDHLERDGLIHRKADAEIPPRVEFALSDLGCTLLDTIEPLVQWTEQHQQEIGRARVDFDARTR